MTPLNLLPPAPFLPRVNRTRLFGYTSTFSLDKMVGSPRLFGASF
jgi:hypothetical protein